MADNDNSDNKLDKDVRFIAKVHALLSELEGEISERNSDINDRDQFIYSDKLDRSIDIPVGHDFTPVNWLRRTVEIHKTMFMGRPFQVISTYNTEDLSMASDDQDEAHKKLSNQKEKTFSEERRNLIDGIIRDNGGHALFVDGAESASAVGSWVAKTYYDENDDKFVISPVEAVENCYALWSGDDFRQFDAFVYAYQVSKASAAERYGLEPDELITSPLGSPFINSQPAGVQLGGANSTLNVAASNQPTGQPMVTIMEVTGKVEGWCVRDGKLYPCSIGSETALNGLFVGNNLVRLISDEKKLPRYYIFPNKRIRRRSWGVSDISEAAININVTYIETLSDWRTLASKINFPKFKGFNFGPDTTMPKFRDRKIELLPLSEGQDMALLQTGDANGLDWGRQLDEIQKQYIRETGISRVLFDDPDITLNSNQALLTSMKPTSDIAEGKKQLWGPILTQLFTDAINTIAMHKSDVKELVDGDWTLKIQWPTVLQKEDPIFQQMLLNRWNAGTLSLQSYLEMQGETKEEIDRMREEFSDPITAAALGKALGPLAQYVLGLPAATAEVASAVGPVATPANNTEGTQPMSQPGSGAPGASPQGALNAAQATNAITGPAGATLQANALNRLP